MGRVPLSFHAASPPGRLAALDASALGPAIANIGSSSREDAVDPAWKLSTSMGRGWCLLRVGVFVLLCAAGTSCPAGQYAMDDYSCAACPEGKYKTIDTDQVPDPHPCFSCLTTGEWSTEGATQCACARGYSGVAGGKEYGTCELCTPGKLRTKQRMELVSCARG